MIEEEVKQMALHMALVIMTSNPHEYLQLKMRLITELRLTYKEGQMLYNDDLKRINN